MPWMLFGVESATNKKSSQFREVFVGAYQGLEPGNSSEPKSDVRLQLHHSQFPLRQYSMCFS